MGVRAGRGELVASLAGWSGARLAQEQIWYKVPGAGPLVFHRDRTYFEDFAERVITVSLALDRIDAAVGPLEYVAGSHRLGDGITAHETSAMTNDQRQRLRSRPSMSHIHAVARTSRPCLAEAGVWPRCPPSIATRVQTG